MDDRTSDAWLGPVLARAREGDPLAFDELVRWLERPLVGFLRARGAAEVEDLANEVLVRVFRRIDRFEGNAAQLRAWVFRITRNLIIDEHRRALRRGGVELTRSGELPDGPRPAVEIDLEEPDRIKGLLASLTADQQEVLLLRVVAELSVEDTAAVMGRRAGAVRALQHRALATLRQEMSRRP